MIVSGKDVSFPFYQTLPGSSHWNVASTLRAGSGRHHAHLFTRVQIPFIWVQVLLPQLQISGVHTTWAVLLPGVVLAMQLISRS